MKKIKSPSVQGIFYPEDKKELRNLIENFKVQNSEILPSNFLTRAVIVPHAGLIYSGALAYSAINLLNKNLKTIIIFAPSHKLYFEGIALTSFDFWQTPFKKIEINKEINNEILEKFNGQINDEAYKNEHSIEVQIPLIQSVFDEVKIVPVLIGKQNYDLIEEIISCFYQNKETGFVVSSDLSHFLTEEKAKKVDMITARMIETGAIQKMHHKQACGACGICGLSLFAQKNQFSLIRVGLTNSSRVNGDTGRVVGYGAWALFEGNKNEFIKKHYRDLILTLAKKSIETKFTNEDVTIDYPKLFDEYGASFVTLEIGGRLRGCIGSIIPKRRLILDIIQNARSAAFEDPRFEPLSEEEFQKVEIAVSILSEPVKMEFKDEDDLLDKIQPFIDGIIIKDGNYQAVYLPSVWEQLPRKREFLDSLKIKAGMDPLHFSETFEAYRFDTVYIK